MNLVHGLTRPYYVYRPSQVWRRLLFDLQKPHQPCWVKLPWLLQIWANPTDNLGYALQTAGINDLTVSECLFRLAEPNELVVDVGANVGYTTSILCVRVGMQGRVVSFEPHPMLYQELCANIANWKVQRTDLGEVTMVNRAVSEQSGDAVLNEPASFACNKGRSTLQQRGGTLDDGRELRVETVTLDSQFAEGEEIGMLKVDVEGHEEQVFTGARKLLSDGRVRDVLFEEFAPYPARTHRMLEKYGFQVFVVEERLSGPVLVSPTAEWKPLVYSPPNYVATRDVERLQRKFQLRGWQCLSGKNTFA